MGESFDLILRILKQDLPFSSHGFTVTFEMHSKLVLRMVQCENCSSSIVWLCVAISLWPAQHPYKECMAKSKVCSGCPTLSFL